MFYLWGTNCKRRFPINIHNENKNNMIGIPQINLTYLQNQILNILF